MEKIRAEMISPCPDCGRHNVRVEKLEDLASFRCQTKKEMTVSNEVALKPTGDIMERVLLAGDLSRLQPQERVAYYKAVCESVGLNPLTKPFEYINLNGKLTLYANRACSEQLRDIHGVSIGKLTREVTEGMYVVTAPATNAKGRTDESIGAVPIANLQGENRANAMMKAETKAKRRVTLSICGLGWLDESEVDSIPGAQRVDAKIVEGEVVDPPAEAKRGPGRPPKAPSGGVKLIDVPKADPVAALGEKNPEAAEIISRMKEPTELKQAALIPDTQSPQVVTGPGVTQQSPPDEEIQLPPIDNADVVGNTPITRETKQRIFKLVSEVNKKVGPGSAQAAMKQLFPDARPVDKLTDEEGHTLIRAWEGMVK